MEPVTTTAAYNPTTVIRHVGEARYPVFPYSPPLRYPELEGWIADDLDPQNEVYEAVRNILHDLDLDSRNFGRPDWNPLRGLVSRGQRALIKPNWVLHASQLDGSIESLITHTSVIRVLLDYLILALDGRGTVEVADAPIQGCDFEALRSRSMIDDLLSSYRSRFPDVNFGVIDLRKTTLTPVGRWSQGLETQSQQTGDPRGYTLIDLGQESLLTDIHDRFDRFRVTMYDHRLMHQHHSQLVHEYLVADSVLSADFVINVPKLKTHIKAGITGALKNLVGINGHKEYLPHHVNGDPETGGDQYRHRSRIKPLINRLDDRYWRGHTRRGRIHNLVQASVIRALRQPSKLLDDDRLFDGGWSGNDTIPRTTLDLNNIMYFYDCRGGRLSSTPVRSVLHVVDGVIAGEGYGPLRPSAKPAGIVMGGWDPLSIDACGARLIGLDPMKVRLIRYGFEHPKSLLAGLSRRPSELRVVADGERLPLAGTTPMAFQLPREWEDAAI